MIHNIRLVVLRNLNNILIFTITTSILTVLILQGVMLTAIYKQSHQNQEVLRGLSCILLIMPEQRTEDNVRECIEINQTDRTNFIFKTPNLDIVDTLKDNGVIITPVKGTNGKDGVNGSNGVNGTNGKDGNNGANGNDGKVTNETVIKEVPVQGLPGDEGKSGKEVEFQYNELKARIEWRYVGDESWQVLVDKCKLTDSCSTGVQ